MTDKKSAGAPAQGSAAQNANPASQSLVRKLTAASLLQGFALLLAMDALLVMLFFGALLLGSERDMAGLVPRNLPVGTTLPGYVLAPAADPSDGVVLPSFFHDRSPLSSYQVTRDLSLGDAPRKLRNLTYTVSFEDLGLSVRYHLGRELSLWAWPFFILLGLEALLLISETGKTRRRMRRILRPITEMSRQVANLSEAAGPGTPSGAMSRQELENLRKWAGALSAIDASRLDLRLSVDDTQKELKDLAEAINRMLDRIDESYRSQIRFVSDASHELRTPISVIQGYVNLLDRWGKNDQATLQEAIDAIKSESESMKNLIEQLLFLARGDSETLRLELSPFDVADTVREVVKEAGMVDPEHRFQVQAQGPSMLLADRQLIKQALRILVDNSIKYTPPQGEITVSVAAEGDRIRISVQDQGIGIDPDSLPYIFDRFYRSEESRTRKAGGAGLGLAIMKWIVDRHGGSIEVLSRKEIGTRTALLLPAAPVSPDGSGETPECSPGKN